MRLTLSSLLTVSVILSAPAEYFATSVPAASALRPNNFPDSSSRPIISGVLSPLRPAMKSCIFCQIWARTDCFGFSRVWNLANQSIWFSFADFVSSQFPSFFATAPIDASSLLVIFPESTSHSTASCDRWKGASALSRTTRMTTMPLASREKDPAMNFPSIEV